MVATSRLLTVGQMAAFAAPAALLFLFRAAAYVIPALYAQRFKLDLADIAGILYPIQHHRSSVWLHIRHRRQIKQAAQCGGHFQCTELPHQELGNNYQFYIFKTIQGKR